MHVDKEINSTLQGQRDVNASRSSENFWNSDSIQLPLKRGTTSQRNVSLVFWYKRQMLKIVKLVLTYIKCNRNPILNDGYIII